MRYKEIDFELTSPIYDGDLRALDNYIFITEAGKVYRNGKEIKLPVSLDEYFFPFIRIFSDDEFLLVDGAVETGKNAWIINFSGKLIRSFSLGDVQKLLLTENRIVASYSPTSDSEYSQKDIVIFDLSGNVLFEYRRDIRKEDQVKFLENYSFLRKDESSIYFMPFCSGSEENFPIVELNLHTWKQEVLFYAISSQTRNESSEFFPQAFTIKEGVFYFLSTDRDYPDHTRMCSRIFKREAPNSYKELGSVGFSSKAMGFADGKFSVPVIFPVEEGPGGIIEV